MRNFIFGLLFIVAMLALMSWIGSEDAAVNATYPQHRATVAATWGGAR